MTEFEKLQFQGKAIDVAETEYAGSFRSEAGERLLEDLVSDYVKAGSPRAKRRWLSEHLKNVFECVGERPQWAQDIPGWPWMDGKPMIFIAQIEMPSTPLVAEKLATNKVLYIFGCRRPEESGRWHMEYLVVAQDRILGKGVRLLADSEADLASGNSKRLKLVRHVPPQDQSQNR